MLPQPGVLCSTSPTRLQGSFLLNSGAFALAFGSIAATVLGLATVLGRAGIAVGAVLMMFIGNPLSAATMPVEFIAQPWGTIGQWMPPGAAASLVRGLSYFPEADHTFAWLVLAGWTIAGLAMLLISPAKRAADRAATTTETLATASVAA